MTTKKKSLLQTVWERTEAAWDALKQARAQANLRAKAEVDLLGLQSKVIEADTKLEEAITKAKDSQEWKPIREAALARDLVKKELEQASKLYEEFFLEVPKFLGIEVEETAE